MNIQDVIWVTLHNLQASFSKPVYYERVVEECRKIMPQRNNASFSRMMRKMAQNNLIQRIKGKGLYYV